MPSSSLTFFESTATGVIAEVIGGVILALLFLGAQVLWKWARWRWKNRAVKRSFVWPDGSDWLLMILWSYALGFALALIIWWAWRVPFPAPPSATYLAVLVGVYTMNDTVWACLTWLWFVGPRLQTRNNKILIVKGSVVFVKQKRRRQAICLVLLLFGKSVASWFLLPTMNFGP